MKQVTTKAIVLRRVDFGEADRIVTFLTDSGKVTVLAKGVRKLKSKLAGGIELFTINEIVFIESNTNLKVLRSARMTESFGNIVKNLERTQAAFTMIQLINRHTEDEFD